LPPYENSASTTLPVLTVNEIKGLNKEGSMDLPPKRLDINCYYKTLSQSCPVIDNLMLNKALLGYKNTSIYSKILFLACSPE